MFENTRDISNEVDALGFQLEDVKIPPDIAERVQGFRIYYAKRDHEHRRILGQGLFHPMLYKFDLLGICKEADDGTDTVYGWVPVDVVNKLIDKHGGLDEEEYFVKKIAGKVHEIAGKIKIEKDNT